MCSCAPPIILPCRDAFIDLFYPLSAHTAARARDHVIISAGMCATAAMLALSFPSLWVVVAFVGSVAGAGERGGGEGCGAGVLFAMAGNWVEGSRM